MRILQVCCYAAAYEGNFIKSLYALEDALRAMGHTVLYAFPEKAAVTEWCRQLQKRTKVFFLPYKNTRLNLKAYPILKKAVQTEKIDILHSHFELYDIACKMAAQKDTKVFWHLHDAIKKARRPDKNIIVKLQYGVFSKNVTLLAVSEKDKKTAVALGFSPGAAKTVLNGIDTGRITYPYPAAERQFDCMTFGWDYYRKGVDIILKVLTRLAAEGVRFRFMLNCTEAAIPQVKRQMQGELPEWLEIVGHTEDVNALFANASVFIQASRNETFCYAACEAAYAGLEVISSDIAGLEWGHTVPSITFFESENEEQLYQLLKERVAKHRRLEPSVIAASRAVIEQNFSVSIWVKHILEEYGLSLTA